MDVKIKKATTEDAEVLVDIYNKAFYEDFVEYGQCPGYGKSVSDMTKSINETSKYIAYVGLAAVGAISVLKKDDGLYYLGALCVIPEYQRKRIGYKLLEFIKEQFKDWKKIELVTPADKEKNINFYTKKCGFKIDSEEMDGTVKVYHLSLNKDFLTVLRF
ncbi:MAG: GNAT family N-acetyltransferase [Treponema sp.]|nr:GNAT family N-acetyltransferase [Treponema sp.]